jgi:hypothetical protein
MSPARSRVAVLVGLVLPCGLGLAVPFLASTQNGASFAVEQDSTLGSEVQPGIEADRAHDGAWIEGPAKTERTMIDEFGLEVGTAAALVAADPDRVVRHFDTQGRLPTVPVRAVVATSGGIPFDRPVTGWLERPEAAYPQLLRVGAEGFVTRTISIGSAGSIDVVMHRSGSAELRVVDGRGDPLHGRCVQVRLGTGGERTRALDLRGASPGRPFEVRGVAHGAGFGSLSADELLTPSHSTPARNASYRLRGVTSRLARDGVDPAAVVDLLSTGAGGYTGADGRLVVVELDPATGYQWSVDGGCSQMEPGLAETTGDRRVSRSEPITVEAASTCSYTVIAADPGAIELEFDTTGLGAIEVASVHLERRSVQLGDTGVDQLRGEARRRLTESEAGVVPLAFRGIPSGDYRLRILCGSNARTLRYDERVFSVADGVADLGVLGRGLERTTVVLCVTDPFGRAVALPGRAAIEPLVPLASRGPLERARRLGADVE